MSSQIAPDQSTVGERARLVPSRPATVDLSALARVGTALADDTRRRMLMALLEGAAYPSDLARDLGLSRPNVSNHLACLRGCGLVVAEAEGRRQRYRLSDPKLAHALSDLCGLALAPAAECDHEVER
jgi:DNA-binding transcriptional ArsR family regulator